MKYRKRTKRIALCSGRVNKKILILKNVLVLFCFWGSISNIFAHDENDLENWHVFILDKNVSSNAGVAFSQEIKYRDSVSDFYLSRMDIAYHHTVSSAIVLSACYKVIHIERDAGWVYASIPYINGLFTWSLAGLSVKHRARFEY